MKRDARLRGLSSEHHAALVLARSLIGCEAGWTPAHGVELGRRFDVELEPHFGIEDALLLPALRRVGATQLAERTAQDHAHLRALVAAARTGDGLAAGAFGRDLGEHVRFEEREVFPACEQLLPDAVLDEVGRRAPKHD